MKMKKTVIVFLFLVGFAFSAFGQGFVEHKVQDGETINSIVRKYKVSPYELYELNPDAKEGISAGSVLVFLKNQNYPYDPTLVDLKRYKVKKRDDLKSIAINNEVTVADIKKFNSKLYAENIRKGDIIKIPVFDPSLDVVIEDVVAVPAVIEHIVKTKETKYGIAHKYHVTIQELEDQNPHIAEGLKVGQLLKIKTAQPEDIDGTTATATDDAFSYYQIKPKEGFFRLTKKLGISKDSLIALNPQLVDGIKLGMVVKYPKATSLGTDRPTFNLIDSLSNFKPRNITVMLPFRYSDMANDSTFNIKKVISRDDNILNRSIDFYSGVLMAVDSAKQLGISTNLKILDTDYKRDKAANTKRIKQLLNRSFAENEVVIGPLVASNVLLSAKELEAHNIPVLAPLPVKGKAFYANVYETVATEEEQRLGMISYLEVYAKDKPIIIVADNGMKAIKGELVSKFPNAKVITPREGDLLIPKDFNGILHPEKENIVIVEASKVGLVATVTSILDTMIKKHQISMFTTSSKGKFDDKSIGNAYKAKLNYHYPSASKEVVFEAENDFVEKYKMNYGKLPSKFALRGFDITLDVLLRQGVAELFEDSVMQVGETKYLESKFNYDRRAEGGYVNKSMYILRYTPELNLEEVSIDNPVTEVLEMQE